MKIYTFYKKNDTLVHVHICAMTYFEAIDAFRGFDNWAALHYDLNEFRLDKIYDLKRYTEILGIEPEYLEVPIVINDSKYFELIKDTKNIKDTWYPNEIERKEKDNSVQDKILQKMQNILNHPTNKGINSFLA